MSPIAAVSAVSAVGAVASSTAPGAERALPQRDGAGAPPPRGARRHELVEATLNALPAAADAAAAAAAARFTHALMHDLRRLGGGDDMAMQSRELGVLRPRIDALATAAAAQAVAAAGASAAGGDAPSPLTPVTAALHVMQVPSSRLVEAFLVLRDAVPSLARPADGATDVRTQLASFLQKLAPAAPSSVPAAGVLFDARA